MDAGALLGLPSALSPAATVLPERIEAGELLLRRWRTGDADRLSEAIAASAGHLRPWMGWMAQEPQTALQRRLLIERWEDQWRAGGDVLLGVFLGDRVVGSCGIHRRLGPKELELGYWTREGFLRQGIATRAAAALTDTVFSLAGIDVIEIHHDKANRASAGVPSRLGFQMVEEIASDVTAPAECGTACIWRMRREDWLAAEARASGAGRAEPEDRVPGSSGKHLGLGRVRTDAVE